jgi:hypothetical protein
MDHLFINLLESIYKYYFNCYLTSKLSHFIKKCFHAFPKTDFSGALCAPNSRNSKYLGINFILANLADLGGYNLKYSKIRIISLFL